MKLYLQYLENAGFGTMEIPAWKCQKGFRFGNGNLNTTSWCVLLPTFFAGERRDMLAYVIEGEAPLLLGRPVMEALKIGVDYASGNMRIGMGEWKPAEKGKKGEYVIRVAAETEQLIAAEPKQVLIPEDFDGHVHHNHQLTVQDLLNEEIEPMMMTALAVEETEVKDGPSSLLNSNEKQVSKVINLESESESATSEDKQADRLPRGKLKRPRQLTESHVKEVDSILAMSKDETMFEKETWTIYGRSLQELAV